MTTRCQWATKTDIEAEYHDQEWGVPVTNDNKHFEFLTLEGAQAGLSWLTILKRRQGYCDCFAQFDIQRVAAFTDQDVERLVQNTAIIRHRGKIESVINNAKRLLEVQEEFGSFNDYIWQFVNGRPIQNQWASMEQLPATTKESDALAKDLKKRGFKFVGSTTVYAHMQAAGLVNDHTTDCFRYEEIKALGEKM